MAQTPPDAEAVFAVRLRETREARGLTQKQLAGLLDLSEGTISRWETTERDRDMSRSPPLAQLARISMALNVSLDWLLGLPEAHEPPAAELTPAAQQVLARAAQKLEAVADVVDALRGLVDRGGGRPQRKRPR